MSTRQRIPFAKRRPCGLRVANAERTYTHEGQVFFRLTVLGKPFYFPADGVGRSAQYVVCRCECGTISVVTTSSILTGSTRSCGCLHVETARIRGLANRLPGERKKPRVPSSRYRTRKRKVTAAERIEALKQCISDCPKYEPTVTTPIASDIEHVLVSPVLREFLPELPVNEVFRHVPGAVGYAVSSIGTIISCRERKAIGRGSRAVFGSSWHIVKPTKTTSRGYLGVWLSIDGKIRPCKVYRLVLKAFVGEPPSSYVACHNNGDTSDNRLANLRWDTIANNHADKVRHGTALLGERAHASCLSDADAFCIRFAISAGFRNYEIAKVFGISPEVVRKIKIGVSYKHVTLA